MMQTTRPLESVIGELVTDHGNQWAWAHLKDTLTSLIETYGLRRVLEIGGGRSPHFSPAEAGALGIDYAINDISEAELALSASDFPPDHRIQFDVSGDVPVTEAFDLVFSLQVLEHVHDTMRAHRNTLALLRPGGVGFHFYPTLYCPPFVANRLLPERLSALVLSRLGATHKKFPAHYDHCLSTRSLETKIRSLGFSEVVLVPFWGHNYFNGIPGLRELDRWLAARARARDYRRYSCYCYAIVRK